MISIIHIPDASYRLSCRILYQYLLLAQGQFHDLKVSFQIHFLDQDFILFFAKGCFLQKDKKKKGEIPKFRCRVRQGFPQINRPFIGTTVLQRGKKRERSRDFQQMAIKPEKGLCSLNQPGLFDYTHLELIFNWCRSLV